MKADPDDWHYHGKTPHWHPGGKTLHDHSGEQLPPPPPPRSGGKGLYWTLGSILLVLVMLGAAMSFFDPSLNFPVVSQVVCSLKGDTWYGGGLLESPGCYAPS